MNQAELIEQIASEADLTKIQTQSALRAMLKTIMQKVADGDKVTLVGFGTFEDIPAAVVPTFSAGKAFREAVNQ
jgi:DNA-binding protein HU-beta